jgi:quinohemoprotein ethanol dehydrogenase
MRFKRLRISKKVIAGGVVAVAVIAGGAATAIGQITSATAIPVAPPFSAVQLNAYAGADWISTGGDLQGDRHSSLTQITTSNASTLASAWSTDLGVCPTHNGACGSEEGTPIVYQGVMYYQTFNNDVFALDASTGQILWRYVPTFDPGYNGNNGGRKPGVGIGDGLVYVGLSDGSLVGLSQTTGQVAWRTVITPWQEGGTTAEAPLYYDHMVIEGTSGGDGGGLSPKMAAFNASTGELLWSFDIDPQTPGTFGANTWSANSNGAKNDPQATAGGGAVWKTPTLDTKLGLLYVSTGSADPWNSRGPGANLFTTGIVALHVNTGQLAWYYQTTHHSIWDDDIPQPAILFNAKMQTGWEGEPTTVQTKPSDPTLASLGVKGAKVKADLKNVEVVATTGKEGWTWLLDAKTGKPLEKIAQVATPQSTAMDVNTWPVQPIPQGPNVIDDPRMPNGEGRLCANPNDGPVGSTLTWAQSTAPDGKPYVLGCQYQPFDTTAYVVMPLEEVDWPASSYDPLTHGLTICNVSNRAYAKAQIPAASQVVSAHGGIGASALVEADNAQNNTGDFSSLNVETNTFSWHDKWATPCYSGSVNTATGLTFVGQIGEGNGRTGQGFLEAVNSKTGQSLWTSPLMTAPATSPPITYSVGGKQYVAIMAGGEAHDDPTGGVRGDTIYAFALPG